MDNQFEKQIREKLDHMEVNPSEGLLDSIFEKRAAKSKPVSVFGFTKVLLAAATITAVVCLVYFTGNNDNKEIANVSDSPVTESKSLNPSDTKSVGIADANVQSSDSKEQANKGLKQGVTKSKPGSEKVIAKSHNSNSNQAGSSTESPMTVNEPFNQAQANEVEPLEVMNYSSFNPDINSYFNVFAKNRPSIASEMHNGNSHLYVYNSVDPNALDMVIGSHSNAKSFSKFPYVFSQFSPENVSLVDVKMNAAEQEKGRPIFVDLSLGRSLSLFGLNGDGENMQTMNGLKSQTTSGQYDLRVSVPVSNRLNVFAGLGYLGQNIRYKGNIDVTKDTRTINTHTTFINDPIKGTIMVVTYDTLYGKKTNTNKVDIKNKYEVYRLPVGLSYNFGYRSFDFALNGSMNINYFKKSNINIWSNSSEQMSVVSKGGFFNIGAGLSIMGAVKLSNQFRWFLEPSIQTMGIKGAKTGNSFNERVFNFGLSTGIRYTVF